MLRFTVLTRLTWQYPTSRVVGGFRTVHIAFRQFQRADGSDDVHRSWWSGARVLAKVDTFRSVKRHPRDLSSEVRSLRHPEDHFSFFFSNREFFSPPDLCILLESVWKHTLRINNEQMRNAQRQLFNTKGFMQVLLDVLRSIERFGPVEMPILLSTLNTMRWHDKRVFKLAEPIVVRQLPAIAAKDLPRLTATYVAARCGSKMLYDEIIHRCAQAARELDCKEVSSLVGTFSRSPHKPKTFLETMRPFIMAKLPDFHIPQFVKIVKAYGAKEPSAPPEFTMRIIAILLQNNGDLVRNKLSPGQITAVFRVLAIWSKHIKGQGRRSALAAVFLLAEKPLLVGSAELRPKDVGVTIWSMTKVAVVPRKLFHTLYEDALRVGKHMPEPTLAACLLACSRVVSKTVPLLDRKQRHTTKKRNHLSDERPDIRILDELEGRLMKTIGNFRPRELSMIVLAYALPRAGSAPLFAVLQRACMEHCRDFSAEQVSSTLWSFATVRLGAVFFREAQFDIVERLHQLTVHSLCDVFWSYCVVRHYDPHFVKALLSTLLPSSVAGDPRCAMLYPALLDFRTKFPNVDPEGLSRYMSYTYDQFHELQLKNAAPKQALQTVSEALSRNSDALNLRYEVISTLDGYVADALVWTEQTIEDADAQPVAVLYHSFRTLHLKANEPLGHTIMRQRHLRSRGIGVVNLWDRSWDKLASDEQQAALELRILEARQQLPKSHLEEESAAAIGADPIMDANTGASQS